MRRKVFKLIHFGSTAWFMLCIGYILVLVLRQAGFRWLFIFSISGQSAVVIFLLISVYLFAIFKGIDRSQEMEIEHPLTSTSYYSVFYDASPFLGAFAGYLGLIEVDTVTDLLLGIALGTLATTFLVWIIVDPAISIVENLLPASRKHRLERLAELRAIRQKRQEERERLLAEIESKEEMEQVSWGRALQPYAEKLADLITGDKPSGTREIEAVDIGVNAWQKGGLNCMRVLHSMAMEICREKNQDSRIVDYVSSWWDGIGNWRSPSPG